MLVHCQIARIALPKFIGMGSRLRGNDKSVGWAPKVGPPCGFIRVDAIRFVSKKLATQNCTFGASRTIACLSSGISSNAAGSNLNMPATTLDGNTSRRLL